jgi:hypothetical protein
MNTINSCSFSPSIYSLQVGGANGKLLNIPASPSVGFVLTSNGASANPSYSSVSLTPIVLTNVSSSPYVASATDYFLSVNTSSLITIQLPNSPVIGRVYVVKDKIGHASANRIKVTTVGGVVLIDGATSYLITKSYQANQFVFDGTNWEVF